jgi:O-succinylbenzoic acid--CoA ligase
VSAFDPFALSPGRADDLAVVTSERRWSYGALRAAVDERAEEMSAASDGPPRAEPLLADPGLSTIVEILAFWRVGRVPAPLNPRLTETERAEARSVLYASAIPPGTCLVLWTSGTSGKPRGVALSSQSLRAISEASRERLALGSGDVWLASLSPAHVGGLVSIVRALLLGSALIVPDAIDGVRMDRMLEQGVEGVTPTHVSLVPTQFGQILDRRGDRPAPAHLRCALIGGAHAPASLVGRAIEAGWPIALTYGATEMCSQIATAPPALVRQKPGTVGAPMVGVELSVSEGGELLVRGPGQALGYVGPTTGPVADQEGWYHTGDLGRVDAQGHLWITGRRIDRIVTGGVTVDAIEVEEAVRAHPAVVDVCVVGLPDPGWGERVAALVVPVVGEFDVDDVDGFVRERNMRAKVPTIWHTAVELPRNANGKVDRTAVRVRLQGLGRS